VPGRRQLRAMWRRSIGAGLRGRSEGTSTDQEVGAQHALGDESCTCTVLHV
jgi:hypothetical protein